MTEEKYFLKKLITILYEDQYFVVFDKPAGLLTIPTPKKEQNTLLHIVNYQYAQAENQPKLYPCHRLDRDTSGAILFARGKENQERMMQAFKDKQVEKCYIAFIHGRLNKLVGEFRSHIKELGERKFTKHKEGKWAVTRYKVKEVRRSFSVLKVYPLTGRTNQIRIHLSEAGHPLVGERKYSFGRDHALKFRRLALHAERLSWTHPVTHKKINVISELPNDMEVFLARNTN